MMVGWEDDIDGVVGKRAEGRPGKLVDVRRDMMAVMMKRYKGKLHGLVNLLSFILNV